MINDKDTKKLEDLQKRTSDENLKKSLDEKRKILEKDKTVRK